ncbi:HAD-IA family hydrolase [archaeon]|jgi:putative hydrolase of the HAD superfamily|nr:HAD-IA family hydrolase [archaeon]MBT7507818.1 HAD-IA family hydrolase [archaeon]
MNKMIKALVFDLDDTLYDNTNYWLGAFKDISFYLEKEYGVEKNETYSILFKIFNENKSMYSHLFDDLITELNITPPSKDNLIKEMVKIFHSHKPELELYDDTLLTLNELKKEYKLGIITNGKYPTQMNKIRLLGLEKYFEVIICPEYINRKPKSQSYFEMLGKLGFSNKEVIYVGDNPLVDFIGAKEAGLITIRIMKGPFKDMVVSSELDAEFKINNLKEIIILLKSV